MSRYEFAVRLAERLGYSADLVDAVSAAEMKGWVARRPRDSSLDTSRARGILRTRFYDTGLALDMFAEE
ncbi:Rossmann-fold NAD(P)-binding domain-containing protein [Thermofilum pendens]|nr:hypothetical protein [Thermofilum pendens]